MVTLKAKQMRAGSLENLETSSAYISSTGEWCWLTSYSHAQFVYTDDTQIRVSPSHYMKYAVGENVMSCIQSAECDTATKISVTERNDNELQLVQILLTLITLMTPNAAPTVTAFGRSRSHNVTKTACVTFTESEKFEIEIWQNWMDKFKKYRLNKNQEVKGAHFLTHTWSCVQVSQFCP